VGGGGWGIVVGWLEGVAVVLFILLEVVAGGEVSVREGNWKNW